MSARERLAAWLAEHKRNFPAGDQRFAGGLGIGYESAPLTLADLEEVLADVENAPAVAPGAVVGRLCMKPGERLLPWPELDQDLAFLCFMIDDLRAKLDKAEELGGQAIRAEAQAVRDLEAQHDAALRLHERVDASPFGLRCTHCFDDDGAPMPWPCPTVVALGGAQ